MTAAWESLSTAQAALLPDCPPEQLQERIRRLADASAERIRVLEQRLKVLDQNAAQSKQLAQQITGREEELHHAEEETAQLGKELTVLTSELEMLERMIQSGAQKLEYPSKEDASAQIRSLTDERQKILAGVENAQKRYQQVLEQSTCRQAKMEQLREQIAACPQTDEQALMTRRTELEQRRTALTQSIREIFSREEQNRAIREQVSRGLSSLTALESKYRMLRELSDTAGGRITGVLEQRLKVLDQNAAQSKQLAQQITGREEELHHAEEETAQLGKELTVLTSELEMLERMIQSGAQKLEYPSKEDASAQIRSLTDERQKILAGVENAQKRYQQVLEQSTCRQAKMEQLREQIAACPQTDEQALMTRRTELEQRRTALTQSIREIFSREEQNRAIREQVSRGLSSLTALESKYRMLRELSDTAGGRITGKEKITLETYIQTTYFDRILARANVRLMKMTYRMLRELSDTAGGRITGKEKITLETYIQTTYFDRILARANVRLMKMTLGQYELIRRSVPLKNQGKSGLDLDVIDHYNGTSRSVRTLSGGESFQASLALALGLSDEVQSSTGIRLDTLFVDEGFGSLDPQALDQAYRALSDLTEGNRLVGIISHVAELKEKIDRQIVDEGFGSLDPQALDQAYRALSDLTEGNRLVGIISHVAELKEKIDRQIVVTKKPSGGSTAVVRT